MARLALTGLLSQSVLSTFQAVVLEEDSIRIVPHHAEGGDDAR